MNVPIHFCSFLQPKVSTIVCLRINENLNLCAIGRKNGAIELWSLEAPHYLIRILSGHINLQLRCLIWLGKAKTTRLFSVGLNGNIIEWDWQSGGKFCSETNGTGGSIWNASWLETKKWLCCACDDGTVRICSITEKNIPISKNTLPCGCGRNLSICVSSSETLLAVGTSESSILIFDLNSWENVERINIDKRHQKEVCVWALESLGTIQFASGNSLGKVTIWDWVLGTQVASFRISRVPILSLAKIKTETATTLYTAGTEGKIHSLCQGIEPHDWQMGNWIRPHVHGITTIDTTSQKLWAGSNDTCFSIICPKTLFLFGKIRPFDSYPPQIIQNQKKVSILDWDFLKIRIWDLNQKPELSFIISPNLDCTLTSCIFNKSIKFIVATDQIKIKAWKIQEKVVSKLDLPSQPGCVSIQFQEYDNDQLLVSYKNFAEIIDCSTLCIKGKITFKKGDITSWAGRWLVIRSNKDLILYNPKTMEKYWDLPSFQSLPRLISTLKNTLFVLYEDNLFRFFSLKTKTLTKWSKENESLLTLIPQYKNIQSVFQCSISEDFILFNGQDWFVLGDIKSRLSFKTRAVKRRKLKDKSIEESMKSCWDINKKFPIRNEKYNSFSFVTKFKPIIGSSLIRKEAYLLSVDWSQCLLTFPMPIFRKMKD